MSKVWLVTGSARGLGRHIAEAVLANGDRLVATARHPEQLADLVEQYGEQIRTYTLDVTDPKAAAGAAQCAVDTYGRIDVLVNNAGYGHVAPFEQTPAEDFRAQIDTNFYGVVNLTRAALPIMRAQRSGHIMQISSVGGRIGTPGLAAYQAAKWAVGGFTEVLAMEAANFGVKFIALEPGGMRTDWAEVASSHIPEILPDYIPSVGTIADMLAAHIGKAAGDPAKVAQVIVKLAAHDQPPPHLLLGSDAAHYFSTIDQARADAAQRWHAVTLSTDVEHAAAIPSFPAY